MRLGLVLAVLVYSVTLADVAFGGLVEVNSSQYLRESGKSQAQYLEVTLNNAGEIRVSNVNLQDGYIELAASTDVLLNGSSLMQPFSLPTGGSAVFPLEAGTHYLEVTLRGKPGGGLKVIFYEDKPDAPVQGKGWELLDDGTVLHRKTGLIWHRNVATPGWEDFGNCEVEDTECPGKIYHRPQPGSLTPLEYIAKLNRGDFGSSPRSGNAGHTDWRVATVSELASTIDFRVFYPSIGHSSGEPVLLPAVIEDYSRPNGLHAGMRYGEPLYICGKPYDWPMDYLGCYGVRETADEGAGWVTLEQTYPDSDPLDGFYYKSVCADEPMVRSTNYCGRWVWPVRGDSP